MITLSFGFKSSLNYFTKGNYLEQPENIRFGKYALFPWRKQKWNIFYHWILLFSFSCLNTLLGLHATIVNCLVYYLATAVFHWLAELPFAQCVNHVSFESSNSQKSVEENTREYTPSTRLCPTRKSRCATVRSMQTSSAFPFCRQLLSSEFSAFFMKVNSKMCHITDFKFKLYCTQIIFSLYIPFLFSKLWTIQNLQSKLFYILVFLFRNVNGTSIGDSSLWLHVFRLTLIWFFSIGW